MAEPTQRNNPASLDALLRANRERFDSLFERQMKVPFPAAVPTPRVRPGSTAAPDARQAQPERSHEPMHDPAAPIGSAHTDVKAELNRRFTIFWSSELLEQEIQNGRAIVRCRLKVGADSRVDIGSSRIGEDQDEQAAVQRAYDAALQKCAENFSADKVVGFATDIPAVMSSAELRPQEQARQAIAQARPLDTVAIDRLQTALTNICQEMVTVCERATPSRAPRDTQPSTALITDAQGRMLAGGFGSYVAHMLQQRALQFGPGDVLLQSDPYRCGGAVSHTNEWLVLVPVFANTELIGFTSMVGQVTDVGADTAMSMPVHAQSVFSEGTRIPPIKVASGGILNEPVLELILNNSRTPQENRAKLLALVAGCRAGAAAVLRQWERMGGARYQQACAALRARSNQIVRQLIRERIPEEPQSFLDQVDDDGCGNGPFKLKLTVWREGDHAYFDWTGSSAQAPGPINLALHVGLAKSLVGMFMTRALERSLLSNDGFHELIHTTLPRGTVLNPEFPAAIGRSEQVFARHLEVLSSALRRHRPDELTPAGFSAAPSLRFTGTDASGVPFELNDLLTGGLSDLLPGEGDNGASTQAQTRVSIEGLERDYSVVIESCASIADSGGAGLHPGDNGIEKVYLATSPGWVSIHDDRHASRPWGVNGGKAGAPSAKWVVRADGAREPLPSKVDRLALGLGDRIVFRTAGHGGSGDPLRRDPALVRQDVRCGLLTPDRAAAEYGVVLSGVVLSGVVPSGSDLEIDIRATRALRERLMHERPPLDLFDYGDTS